MTIFQNVPIYLWCDVIALMGNPVGYMNGFSRPLPPIPLFCQKLQLEVVIILGLCGEREGQLIPTQLLVSLVSAYWLSNVLRSYVLKTHLFLKLNQRWLLVECLWMPMTPFYVRRSWIVRLIIDLLCRVYAKRSESVRKKACPNISVKTKLYENA